jgi:cysteine synthase
VAASFFDNSTPHSVLELIGNTPLLSFKRIGRDRPGVSVMAKAEWYNPAAA